MSWIRLQLASKGKAVLTWKLDVHQDEIGTLDLNAHQGLWSGRCETHVITATLKQGLDQQLVRWVVFDDQDHGGGSSFGDHAARPLVTNPRSQATSSEPATELRW